ncbi:MAG: ABC transporter substrate-binding protein [Betaproteobacteria bacterium]|nr:ABC transporter substrate-binding protein [Betaproteobacteria bacterium]
MTHLKMVQSVAGVFYLPHFIAQQLGAFRDEGLTVEFVTRFRQRWELLESGEVDIVLAGPTRNMRLQVREGRRMWTFCAALRANPWFLIGRRPAPDFTWADLVGRTVLGFADDPQGTCLRWVLLQHGIGPDQVTVIAGRDTASEIDSFRAGQGDYLLHSLHTAAPLVATGEAAVIRELATPTGPVPWSLYATLPDVARTRRAELEAFTRAIARALRWVAAEQASSVAALLVPYFPDWTLASLTDVIGTYKPLNIWPRDPLIPRADWEHYNEILLATSWLPRPVAYEDQVDASFAEQAMTALNSTGR